MPAKNSRMTLRARNELAEDPRAFDLKCVGSALAAVNAALVGQDAGATEFAWADAVVKRRLARIGWEPALPESSYVLAPTWKLGAVTAREFLLTLSYALPSGQDAINAKEVRSWLLAQGDDLDPKTRGQTLEQTPDLWGWVCDRQDVLPLEPQGRIRFVSTPQMVDIRSCLAYALSVVFDDRWGFADRIRACRYTATQDEPRHLFLDYRLDTAGQLAPGTPMEFCCANHANRHRQREFRRRRAAERAAAKHK